MRYFESIRSKFVAGVFFISSLMAGVTGLVGYESGRKSLTDSIENHLATIRDAKSYHLASYVRMVRNHVLVYSESLMVRGAARGFVDAFRKMKSEPVDPAHQQKLLDHYRTDSLPAFRRHMAEVPEIESLVPGDPAAIRLQYHYLAANPHPADARNRLLDAGDGSEYSRVHSEYHHLIDKLRTRFEYGNVLIFDPASLDLVYSSMKYISLGTNYSTGPYAGSALAASVRRAATMTDPEYVEIVDFENYLPEFGMPAAFAVTRVLDGGKVLAVIAFEISSSAIYRILSDDNRWELMGLGKSGEILVLGPGGRLRSESRLFLQDPSGYCERLRSAGVDETVLQKIDASDSSVLSVRVKSYLTDRIAESQTGTAIVTDYLGTNVLAAFAPLRVEGLKWGVVVKLPTEEAFAPIAAYKRKLIVAFFGLGGLCVLSAAIAGSAMASPIKRLTAAVKAYSQGDSEVRVSVRSGDEIQQLAETFNAMAGDISQKADHLRRKLQVNRRLIEAMMPRMLFSKVRENPEAAASNRKNATLAFFEIEGLEQAYAVSKPEHVSNLLNELFVTIDEVAARHGIEKIASGGATYLAACGLENRFCDRAERMIEFALDVIDSFIVFNAQNLTNFSASIGIHSGSVNVSTSRRKWAFMDLWTRTVSLAAEIEGVASNSAVRVSREVHDLVKSSSAFEFVQDDSDAQESAWTLVLHPNLVAIPQFERQPVRIPNSPAIPDPIESE